MKKLAAMAGPIALVIISEKLRSAAQKMRNERL